MRKPIVIEPGQFVPVANRPPYKHIRASTEYFATRGEIISCGQRRTVDLLFTPNELRRTAHRAQMNREDVPATKRRTLLAKIEELLGLS
jgi:hypothetical protein